MQPKLHHNPVYDQ